MNFKITALVTLMASASFAPAAFAVNHDETFPRILEMVTSASVIRPKISGVQK